MRSLSFKPHQHDGQKLKKKRKTEGFNLAFLDIMSCGLGAIILVFMLVKYNEDTSTPELDALKAEVAQLETTETELAARLAAAQEAYQTAEQQVDETSQDLAEAQSAEKIARQEQARKQAELDGLKKDIEKIDVKQTEDVIEKEGAGEENYLIGLKVEGRKIGILIDSSASMTDPLLIDVIRRKNGSDSDKMAGPKWQRTRNIVRWLLARLPSNSEVMAVSFSEKARQLGGTGWASGGNQAAVSAIIKDLGSVIPSGATNLQSGLNAIRRHQPSNVYLITDGLPTMGDSNYKSLNPFSDCNALWGGSAKISGDCRLMLFEHTLNSSSLPANVPVNVVLLPIEGDPQAAPAFWSWAAATGGLMISPAETWP